MEITEDTIDHIAHLARLQFDGDKKAAIKSDLERITDFMDKLNELDTEEYEPLIFMSDRVNNLREDVAKTSVSHEEALKNAPKKDSDYFRIPKVLDNK